jgi:muramoyltetrapeptide carboxypeptidase
VGDTIGIVAPAAVSDALAVDASVRLLERAGYHVWLGDSAFRRTGYLAGTDQERRDDLVDAFRDPSVRAIFCTRGGYGSGRLLPLLAAALRVDEPKIFVGYSDLTFLLTYMTQQCDMVAFHGPMISDFETRPQALPQLLALLGGDRAGWNLSGETILEPGTAEGVLTGGCLSAVVAALGTPYAIETEGKILFLEDVNEKPFRVDRMLTQLRQAGKLDGVAGVMFGEMAGCSADPKESVSVADVIGQHFANGAHPVVLGIPSGHGAGTATLPMGLRVRLAGQRLTFLESPFGDGT